MNVCSLVLMFGMSVGILVVIFLYNYVFWINETISFYFFLVQIIIKRCVEWVYNHPIISFASHFCIVSLRRQELIIICTDFRIELCHHVHNHCLKYLYGILFIQVYRLSVQRNKKTYTVTGLLYLMN